MAIDILTTASETLAITQIAPDPYVEGELVAGAHPTGTAIIEIPIPAGSEVKDLEVTFRDRRSNYDDDSRTIPIPVSATRAELVGDLPQWTDSDFTFTGRQWRRHRRRYTLSPNVVYDFFLDVVIDSDSLLLMLQDSHANRSNEYGGWENLTVNFTDITDSTQVQEVEIYELVGTYYPTVTESSAVSIQTGIDMTHPDTYLRVRYSDTSTDYTYVAEVIKPRAGFTNSNFPQTINAFYEQGSSLSALVIGIENDVLGIVENVNASTGSANVTRINQIDVFVPKKIKIIK